MFFKSSFYFGFMCSRFYFETRSIKVLLRIKQRASTFIENIFSFVETSSFIILHKTSFNKKKKKKIVPIAYIKDETANW